MINQAEEPASRSRSRKPDDTLLVLVVEDEPAQREVLHVALEARGLKVVAAATGLEAMRFLSVQSPDLVVLDLGLPDFDGVELCRRMRLTLTCPIIVVSADSDERRMVAALDIGADDYVTKPYGVDMLMARVRVALRHATALAGAVEQTRFQVGDLQLDVPAHLATAAGRPLELSPRQFRLLTALVRNAGMVLTHKQLGMVTTADGDDGAGSDGLRGAISHLRKRLGVGPERPRIVTEPQVGYRMLPPG